MRRLPRANPGKEKTPSPKRRIRAVVFDLDGVLIDSESVFSRVVKAFLKREHSVSLTEDDVARATGMSDEGLFSYVSGKYGITVDRALYLRTVWKYFRERKSLPKTKNSLRAMRKLSKMGLPIAVASSSYKWYVGKFLKSGGFSKYVSFFLGRDDVGKRKPNPEIYLLAARRLKVQPKDCLAVEDSEPGILAAKRAGMFCIALKGPHNPEKIDRSRADLVVSDLSEIPEILLRKKQDI